MIRIERQRVVVKSENELDELICGICQDILFEPVVTQCCQQTYCKFCINQWLIDRNTCPNDRSILNSTGLSAASRLVVNLINKLNIKCENHLKGCEVVLKVEDMKGHIKTCSKACSECSINASMVKQHILQIEVLQQTIQKRDNDIKLLTDRLYNLIAECETTQQLLKDKDVDINELGERIKGLELKNESDTIISVRKNFNESIYYEKNLSEIEKKFFIEQTKQSLYRRDSFCLISKDIKEMIKDNPQLNVFEWVLTINHKSSLDKEYIMHSKNISCLYVNYGELSVKICGFKGQTPTQTRPQITTSEKKWKKKSWFS